MPIADFITTAMSVTMLAYIVRKLNNTVGSVDAAQVDNIPLGYD